MSKPSKKETEQVKFLVESVLQYNDKVQFTPKPEGGWLVRIDRYFPENDEPQAILSTFSKKVAELFDLDVEVQLY